MTLLAENRVALSSSDQAWESFIETETLNARREATVDAALVVEKSAEAARQQELKARRTRKQEAAIYEWSESIQDVDRTRVAHVSHDSFRHAPESLLTRSCCTDEAGYSRAFDLRRNAMD